MLNIKQKLLDLSLSPQNAVVIGSGILNALNLRESNDIDIIVDEKTYQRLKSNSQFEITRPFGLDLLKYDVYEIGTVWVTLDKNKTYSFKEIFDNSVVIDEVRYNSLEFLLAVKKIWANSKNSREKDKRDIELIENYLQTH